MKAVVVYESMYGNTHLVADAIASGLREKSVEDVSVVPVDAASEEVAAGADLVVVGGPTHVHGMSREGTRRAAVEIAHTPSSGLALDDDAEGPGLREWFDSFGSLSTDAAAFDTRITGPAALTGRASKGIAKRLRDHGCTLVVKPESFLVTRENHLLDHEAEHARGWGAQLAAVMVEHRATAGE
jgi:hypothetical protein